MIRWSENLVDFTMNLWNTEDSTTFYTIAPFYYVDAEVVLVAYKPHDGPSLRRARLWLNEIEEKGSKQSIVFLVGVFGGEGEGEGGEGGEGGEVEMEMEQREIEELVVVKKVQRVCLDLRDRGAVDRFYLMMVEALFAVRLGRWAERRRGTEGGGGMGTGEGVGRGGRKGRGEEGVKRRLFPFARKNTVL